MALSLLCARIIVKKLGPREYGGSGLQGTGVVISVFGMVLVFVL